MAFIARKSHVGEARVFREIVRKKNALPREESIELLKSTKRGVLAVLGDDAYPYAVPLNHYYCEEDGCLYFHGGSSGHRVDAVAAHDKVSFCVMSDAWHEDGDPEWMLSLKSVIVFGRMEVVGDNERMLRVVRELSHKFTSDDVYIEREIERSGHRTLMYALVPEHITGKRIKEA